MKRSTFRRSIRIIVLSILPMAWSLGSASDLLDLRGAEPIHGDAAAGASKATVCVACHGPGGNSVVPIFPNLAGQKVDYLYWELVSIKRAASPESPMTAIVAPLDDADMRDLAAYFAAQAPTAGNPSTQPDTGRGGRLFNDGDPARGIPPCQGCHGVDGGGIAGARFATWPILRGQHADYVASRLKSYRAGTANESSSDFIMHGVAGTLDDESIAALAAWLGSLPPAPAR